MNYQNINSNTLIDNYSILKAMHPRIILYVQNYVSWELHVHVDYYTSHTQAVINKLRNYISLSH